ncbi:Dual specificity phosphatase [Handroanthus impetiginosus]|uniref:Dual specificity phosphatase n=1 Tax=Handroanthus impetiginosus TaxID=429701 RepID=A0A2G9GAP8_9LAMI|nr:Dual specificity phosphatase [Handroanthus impetiginosus]
MDADTAALLKLIHAKKIAKEDNVPFKIEEGLYLGSIGAANNKSALKSLNVTHILTVANSLAPAHPNDFIYKLIQVPDRQDVMISQYFDECFTFIEEARKTGGGVLVHCYDGRSRSVTVVVAYLMFKNGMSLSEALAHVRTRRQVASPNSGFILQLSKYGRSLRGTTFFFLFFKGTD